MKQHLKMINKDNKTILMWEIMNKKFYNKHFNRSHMFIHSLISINPNLAQCNTSRAQTIINRPLNNLRMTRTTIKFCKMRKKTYNTNYSYWMPEPGSTTCISSFKKKKRRELTAFRTVMKMIWIQVTNTARRSISTLSTSSKIKCKYIKIKAKMNSKMKFRAKIKSRNQF